MLTFSEALARLLGSVTPLGAERVSLDEAAGRVLAEDVRAPAPLPPFDYSAMDGYALAARISRAKGRGTSPCDRRERGGRRAPVARAGSACRIFTGARLPEGADAVVMQENVERRGDRITSAGRARGEPHSPARGRSRRGSDRARARPAAHTGDGSRSRPRKSGRQLRGAPPHGDGALLGGRASLTRRGRAPEGSVVESNGYFVAAAARAAGAIARVAPFVRDDEERREGAVREALRGSDLVVTIGGVSVGDRDVIKPALEAAGVTLDFWKVKIKPGKPLAGAMLGATRCSACRGTPPRPRSPSCSSACR
jgi:molybdopterin molybdotransferase